MDASISTESTFANATSSARSWKFFAEQINTAWRKNAKNFIDCGHLLIEAKEELARDAFAVLIRDRLAFDASVGRKLMRLAGNPIICANWHKLPPSGPPSINCQSSSKRRSPMAA
jgi:hypothetical protein